MEKRIAWRAIRALVLAIFLSACAPSPTPKLITSTPAPTPDPGLIARNYPKVDGSTSAHPLQVLIACKILDVPCAWQTAPLNSERMIGITGINRLAATDAAKTIWDLQYTGTNGAYLNLIKAEVDFILVARAPSEDELRAAQQHGIRLDVKPIALDAFVFLVNVQNPLETLGIDQVREIYTGKFKDWSEVGGSPGKISAFQRDRNSGSQELMEQLVMRGAPMIQAREMILPGMMGPINRIRDDALGIGYSVFFYAMFMLPEKNINLIGVNGIKPTTANIASRAYPLVTEVYAVVRAGTPLTSPAVMLRDWLFTESGKAVIAESGYVPIR